MSRKLVADAGLGDLGSGFYERVSQAHALYLAPPENKEIKEIMLELEHHVFVSHGVEGLPGT